MLLRHCRRLHSSGQHLGGLCGCADYCATCSQRCIYKYLQQMTDLLRMMHMCCAAAGLGWGSTRCTTSPTCPALCRGSTSCSLTHTQSTCQVSFLPAVATATANTSAVPMVAVLHSFWRKLAVQHSRVADALAGVCTCASNAAAVSRVLCAGASAAQPGLRINLGRGSLLRQFPDAFAPYMHFGCNMEVSTGRHAMLK
jgi:hypothetical protein